jgi:rod shape-determining protein MreD
MSRPQIGDNIHGDEILLPVPAVLVALTLLAALLLDLVPTGPWTRHVWPDAVALLLVYWGVYQPHRLGLWPAFALGLLLDVHDASLFGQHALAWVTLTWAAMSLHRRIRMLRMAHQVMHVAALLVGAQLVNIAVQLAAGGDAPGFAPFTSSLIGAALWPPLASAMKLPLRPRANPDAARS